MNDHSEESTKRHLSILEDEKRAKEKLQESVERFQRITSIISDYAYTFRVNPDYTLSGEWVSDSFIKIFGFTLSEIDERGGWQSMVFPDDLPSMQQHAMKVAMGANDICETRFVTRNGEIRWILDYATPVWDEKEKRVVKIYGAAQDITERKNAELEILQRNKEMEILDSIIKTTTTKLELQKILDTALEGAITLTGLEGGTLCLVDNENMVLNLFAAKNTSKEMIDELSSQSIKIGDCLCGQAAKTGEPLILWDNASGSEYATHESVRKEGISFHAAFPLTSSGKTLGVLCVFSRNKYKPSERSLKILQELCGTVALAIENAKLYQQVQEHAKELELKVNERTEELQEINKELESFTYSVSHDLRAPLRAITGFAEIISRRYKSLLDKEGQHYFENIVIASEQMRRLIDDLLDYSRLGKKIITLRPISFKEITDKVLKNLSETIKQTNTKIQISEPLPEVLGDYSLLTQVFQNLIDNAIKYRRKKVTPKINISCFFEGESVIIKIKDNGIGIDPKYHEKIFNVFQRLHSDTEIPGTGIGLASVKKAVTMMNGKVWLESEVGKGSTFFVKLMKA